MDLKTVISKKRRTKEDFYAHTFWDCPREMVFEYDLKLNLGASAKKIGDVITKRKVIKTWKMSDAQMFVDGLKGDDEDGRK
jgi:hypothetical protein